MSFEDEFEKVCRNLGTRYKGFKKIFEELDKIPHPVIIETGCVRREDSWNSDGSSTVLFDKYVQFNGGELITIDINQTSTDCARKLCSLANVITADSIETLKNLAETGIKADLLYLDSFDCDWKDIFPSANHHLKELEAALPMITDKTLIVVDDCFYTKETKQVLGKGYLVAKYMSEHGAEPFLLDYQCGWKHLNKSAVKRTTTRKDVEHGKYTTER